tara:strand:+ start:34235 stop:34366 length:132 start_codon:yes stop_codon:yes gene_type:complete
MDVFGANELNEQRMVVVLCNKTRLKIEPNQLLETTFPRINSLK